MSEPMAKLVNNEKGTWFKGRADNGIICEGDDALIYQPEYLKDEQVNYWRSQIQDLVDHEYAVWL